jgi:hypothetical protein
LLTRASTRIAVECDVELCRERPRHDLGERETEPVFLFGDPAPLLHEVAMHEAYERDGTAEAEGAQVQEVLHELGKTRARLGR